MNICVFCGSSVGGNPIYTKKAIALAQEFIRQDIGLIYGAGSVGLMGVIAEEMLKKKKRVIGVAPLFLQEKEVVHKTLTALHLVESMAERKEKMIALSDAFIAMPGGFGTLDELSEVLTLLQLEQSDKAVALFNVQGFFDPFLAQIDKAVKEKFIRAEHAKNLLVGEDEKQLIQECKNFKAPNIQKWIDDLRTKNTY
jgi:uncharacterized protein (TIGR00730 family)